MAQIDHLLINRGTGIFLIETKNYSGDLVINDRGEFTALYGEDKYGIESPLEQSLRHERVLMKLLERLDITSRTGEHPKIHHVVMLHPKAVITRPDPKAFDTRNVIKADQFPSWHKQFVDGLGVTGMLSAALNMRSLDTIREWGEKLRRQHRPDDPLRLPDFMAPSEVKPAEARQVAQPKSTPVNPITVQQDAPAPREKRLICSTCGGKISFAEGRFCWNNPTRFGGLQYCREHQQQF